MWYDVQISTRVSFKSDPHFSNKSWWCCCTTSVHHVSLCNNLYCFLRSLFSLCHSLCILYQSRVGRSAQVQRNRFPQAAMTSGEGGSGYKRLEYVCCLYQELDRIPLNVNSSLYESSCKTCVPNAFQSSIQEIVRDFFRMTCQAFIHLRGFSYLFEITI